MNKPLPVSLVALAGLLLAGSTLAQTVPKSTSPDADADRVDRRCTSATLSSDTSSPCSDDVLIDRTGPMPRVVRPPGNNTAGNGNTSGTPTGTPVAPAGIPSTGSVSPGTASTPGATGTAAGAASGAAGAPARR